MDSELSTRSVSKLWVVLGLLIAIAVGLVATTFIEKNTSAFFLAPEHPARTDHTRHQEIFSRTAYSTFILVRMKDDADIYRDEHVQFLTRLHQELESIDLLESMPANRVQPLSKKDWISSYNLALQKQNTPDLEGEIGQYLYPIKSVKSLLNTDNIYEIDDDLIVESNFKLYESDVWPEASKSQIRDNELLRGSLFSNDEHGLVVQVEFSVDDEDSELNIALVEKIKAAVDSLVVDNNYIESVHYAGGPVLNNALSEVMEKDNATYFPLVIIFVLLTLSIFYRSVLCAFYGLTVSVLSIVFTMALMPVLGVSLNIVTTILPVFIITIAVTDSIHVMSDVASSSAKTNKMAVEKSVKKLFRPMLLTSLTTGLGFLSLTFTEIGNIREFGLMVAISVVIAFALSVTLLPWMLSLRPITRKGSSSQGASTSQRSQMFVQRFVSLATSRRFPSIVCLTVALFLILLGLPKLKIDQASIEAFDDLSEMRRDNQAFIDSGTGSVMLNVWLEGSETDAALDSEVLELIRDIQSALKDHPFYVDSTSLVDFLQRTHDVLEGGGILDLSDSERIRQYLFLLEGGVERDLDTVTTVGDYRQTRIAVSLAQDNSAAIGEIVEIIDRIAEGRLAEGVYLKYAGYAWIVYATADEVLSSQINSLLISLVAIFAVFLIVFRSLVTALIGMVPLTATLATMFGVMGVFGFPLDVGSSLVAGIAFGIGIDYAIHLIEAIRRNKSQASRLLIVKEALSQVTMPITVSAIVLSSGFSLLLLSGFKSLASLGLLVMVSMLVSALFSLIIVPMLLRLVPMRIFDAVAGRRGVEFGTGDHSIDYEAIYLDKAGDKRTGIGEFSRQEDDSRQQNDANI